MRSPFASSHSRLQYKNRSKSESMDAIDLGDARTMENAISLL